MDLVKTGVIGLLAVPLVAVAAAVVLLSIVATVVAEGFNVAGVLACIVGDVLDRPPVPTDTNRP